MSSPVRLGIDTATAWLSLALWSPAEQRVIAERELLAERRHAELLLPTLNELLAEGGVTLDAVDAIGVGIGPGSYTGLRVGIASAQGLAAGLGCPLSGVDSLQAAAWARLKPGQTAWLTLDARRGNVYAGLYERSSDSVSTVVEPLRIASDELAGRAGTVGQAIVEAEAPSAAWIARRAGDSRRAEAIYL